MGFVESPAMAESEMRAWPNDKAAIISAGFGE
jgi:hypothetical protein